jgi:NAD(P)-dependent dehydrogenase (short-subunit alcohol dehydrogenase family)
LTPAGAAVIVTGGGHGIGRACAVRLAEEGAQIAVADLIRPRRNKWLRPLRTGIATIWLFG